MSCADYRNGLQEMCPGKSTFIDAQDKHCIPGMGTEPQ